MSSKVIELKTECVVPITRDRQLDLTPETLITDIKPELDKPWIVAHNGKAWLCFGLTLVVKFERRADTLEDMDRIYVYVRRTQARPYNGKDGDVAKYGYRYGYVLPENSPVLPQPTDKNQTTKMGWDEAMSIAPLGTPIKEVIQKMAERTAGEQMVKDIMDRLNASTLSVPEARKQLGLEQTFDDVLDSKSEEPKDVIYE